MTISDARKRLKRNILIFTALVFMIVVASIFFIGRHSILSNEERKVQDEVNNAAEVFEQHMNLIEKTVNGLSFTVTEHLEKNRSDSLMYIIKSIVADNEEIIGSCVAVERGVLEHEGPHFMLYAHNDVWKNVVIKELKDSVSYNYRNMEWYVKPKQTGQSGWSQPYFDQGAGNVLMCTYSKPVMIGGKFVGVLTADISLGGIASVLQETHMLSGEGICFMTSSDNEIIYHTSPNYIMSSAPMVPEKGEMMFVAEVPATGWVIGKIVPTRKILHPLEIATNYLVMVCIVLLIALYFVLTYLIKRLSDDLTPTEERDKYRMEVARQIKHSAMPDRVRLDPIKSRIQLATAVNAATSVEGDFFNYRLYSGFLYFMVGSVSDSGINASVDIAVLEELLATLGAECETPANIANRLNTMFIQGANRDIKLSAVLGRINTSNFDVELCNANGFEPIIFDEYARPSKLDLPANPEIGGEEKADFKETKFTLRSGQHILLYTHGVVELPNAHDVPFGQKAIMEVCANYSASTATQVVEALRTRLREYVNGITPSLEQVVMDIHRPWKR